MQAFVWKDEPEKIYDTEVERTIDRYDVTSADFSCISEIAQISSELAYDDTDNFVFTTGSIFTMMATINDAGTSCNVKFQEDARGNTINIFVMIPQYVVITMGEVLFY